jgi:hypothetical protein
MVTLQAIEQALLNGKLYVRMNSGKLWQCRRNGATKLWKTRPDDFRIPVKAGLKLCGAVNDVNTVSYESDDNFTPFVIRD